MSTAGPIHTHMLRLNMDVRLQFQYPGSTRFLEPLRESCVHGWRFSCVFLSATTSRLFHVFTIILIYAVEQYGWKASHSQYGREEEHTLILLYQQYNMYENQHRLLAHRLERFIFRSDFFIFHSLEWKDNILFFLFPPPPYLLNITLCMDWKIEEQCEAIEWNYLLWRLARIIWTQQQFHQMFTMLLVKRFVNSIISLLVWKKRRREQSFACYALTSVTNLLNTLVK